MGADLSNGLVVGMGMGTVFTGLVCLILICYITGAICKKFVKKSDVVENIPAPTVNNAPIQNKQEVLAAVCAVIAEEIGTEANNIKVVSFKRI